MNVHDVFRDKKMVFGLASVGLLVVGVVVLRVAFPSDQGSEQQSFVPGIPFQRIPSPTPSPGPQFQESDLSLRETLSKQLKTVAPSASSKPLLYDGLPPSASTTTARPRAIPLSYAKYLSVPLTDTGLLTLYPIKRQVESSGYLYFQSDTPVVSPTQYVINPIALYQAGNTALVEAFIGKRVTITGTIYQQFTDPSYPKETQQVVQLETIEAAP